MGAQKQITNKMQSKKHSMLESITNVSVGFLVTLVFSPFIYTLCGMKYTWGQLGWVTLIFTALSIARSYVIRRFFNKKTDKPKEVKGIPCDPDHNGECLVCDCWVSDCGYQRYLNRDYKYESKEQLEHMFKDYITKEEAIEDAKNHVSREFDKTKLNYIANSLKETADRMYYKGDMTDLGNEIGYIVGGGYKNMTEEDIKEFIMGFKHGVSLTNGTHG